ncbi:MAG: formylglycine-generating enzyme family protein [Halobacteriales archaeon]
MARRTRRDLLGALGAAWLGSGAGCARLRDGGSPTDGTTDRTRTPATRIGPDDAVPTVRIDAGTYTVGTDSGPEDARPAHEVSLAAFRIDAYEVTNALFAAFLNDLDLRPVGDAPPGGVAPSDLRASDRPRLIEGPEGEERRPLAALDDEHSRIGISEGAFVVQEGYADHPVTEVTWFGAQRFARWRGARLPTEAEWEATARGQEGRVYPWGDAEPTHEHAVYGQSSGDTAPVGTHPKGATPSGIHDMAGNVSEWTSSLYRPYPYDADDGREDPTVRGERVTRGGAHVFFGPDELRAYYRTGFSREFDRGHRHIGFRCARSVSET